MTDRVGNIVEELSSRRLDLVTVNSATRRTRLLALFERGIAHNDR